MVYIMTLNTFYSFSLSLMEIGHLSIIPVVAKDESEVVELNTWRFVFHVFFQAVTAIQIKVKTRMILTTH